MTALDLENVAVMTGGPVSACRLYVVCTSWNAQPAELQDCQCIICSLREHSLSLSLSLNPAIWVKDTNKDGQS